MTRRRRSQQGFTLVELMTVVAIIALLAAFLFTVSGQTYGARPDQVAQNLAAQMNLAKMRAVSTRKIHKVTVVPEGMHLEQATTIGFSATPGSLDYDLVQSTGVPAGITIWDVSTAACGSSPCSGAPTAANASLSAEIYFQPDGSSTGATVFITDSRAQRQSRVSVYRFTGGTRVRHAW